MNLKFVVDANVLFSFFKEDSSTRRFILSHPELELIVPEYLFEELEEHKEEIMHKSRIDDCVFGLTKKELSMYVAVLPVDKFRGFWKQAKKLSPDPDDTQYFAVALATGCVIWSNDNVLKQQSSVKVFSTKELFELFGL